MFYSEIVQLELMLTELGTRPLFILKRLLCQGFYISTSLYINKPRTRLRLSLEIPS